MQISQIVTLCLKLIDVSLLHGDKVNTVRKIMTTVWVMWGRKVVKELLFLSYAVIVQISEDVNRKEEVKYFFIL